MNNRIKKLISLLFIVVLGFAFSVQSHAQTTVDVTGVVPPKPSDLQNELTSLTSGTTFAQRSEINYEITYGLSTLAQQNLTLQATWSLGSFESGANNPSTEVLEYVIGSATNGYNNTAPVIDLTNRTITWTISNFPGNTTGQTVHFTLRTNSNYTGSARASFQIQSTLNVSSTIVTDSITNQSYLYNYDPNSYTNSLTPGPTTPPTPTPTPPPNVDFAYIIIPEIRQDRAKVEIKTNIHTEATIYYGTTPNKLNARITSLKPAIFHFFTLDELKPQTTYYFKIEIKDAYRTKKSITSDIFTFSTAKVSEVPEVNNDTIIFTSNYTILFDAVSKEGPDKKSPVITVPIGTPFEFKFSLADGKSVKNILTIMRESTLSQAPVLGIRFTPQIIPSSNNAQIVEVEKGVYIGRLLSNPTPGLSDVIIRVSDFEGNIIEHKLGTIKTVNPLKIVNKKTHIGLENAKITLSLYNPTQMVYQRILPEVIPIQNPAYSDSQGIVDMVLPNGKYRAEISLVRFEPISVEFTIGPYENEEYPTVELTPKPFSLFEYIKYYLGIFFDFQDFTKLYTHTLLASGRIYDLLNLFAITLLGATTLLVLCKTLWEIVTHLFYPWYKRKRNYHHLFLQALIRNVDTDKPIRGVTVSIIDLEKDKIIASKRSNRFGFVTFHIKLPASFRLSIIKNGFESEGFYEYKAKETNAITTLYMKQFNKKEHRQIVYVGEKILQTSSFFFFEISLFSIILFEILFTRSYGIKSILPLIILTTVTLVLIEGELLIRKRK